MLIRLYVCMYNKEQTNILDFACYQNSANESGGLVMMNWKLYPDKNIIQQLTKLE